MASDIASQWYSALPSDIRCASLEANIISLSLATISLSLGDNITPTKSEYHKELYSPSASDIASQWYSALPSGIRYASLEANIISLSLATISLSLATISLSLGDNITPTKSEYHKELYSPSASDIASQWYSALPSGIRCASG